VKEVRISQFEHDIVYIFCHLIFARCVCTRGPGEVGCRMSEFLTYDRTHTLTHTYTHTHTRTRTHTHTHPLSHTHTHTHIHTHTHTHTHTHIHVHAHTLAAGNTHLDAIAAAIEKDNEKHDRSVSLSLLQCVAVCCSVLQCVAVCCSVLQCVAVCCSRESLTAAHCITLQHTATL